MAAQYVVTVWYLMTTTESEVSTNLYNMLLPDRHPLLSPPAIQPKPRNKPHESLVVYSKEWLSQVEHTISPSTQRVVRNALQSMLTGLRGGTPTTQNLHLWLRARVSVDRVSPATLQLERVYVNRFFAWCVLMGYLGTNPLKPIPAVPVPVNTRRRAITDEEFERLKASSLKLSDGLYYPMIIGWYTGARLIDIVHMLWYEIDWSAPSWTFRPKKTKRSGRTVVVPLFGPLLASLQELHGTGGYFQKDYVFPALQSLHERGGIQGIFRKTRDEAQVPKEITFHCFRHTRMTRMVENGMDLLTAADILGLSNVNTLRKYNHASLAKKQQAMSL